MIWFHSFNLYYMQMEKCKSASYCIVSKLKFEVFSLLCCKWKNYKSCGANSANSNCCGDRQEIIFSISFKSSFIYLKKKFCYRFKKFASLYTLCSTSMNRFRHEKTKRIRLYSNFVGNKYRMYVKSNSD